MSTLNFTRGPNGKPAATHALEEALSAIPDLSGECFFGYPLIPTPEGKVSLDGTLISSNYGVVLFDIVEGPMLGEFQERQDNLFNKIEARLKVHKELIDKRKFKIPICVVTFAPGISRPDSFAAEGYPVANVDNLRSVIQNIDWAGRDEAVYRSAVSAIESLSSIRKSRSKREVIKPDSRGAKLKKLEDSIATLDHRQNKAVVETIDGVQRIRGLAGSGKTIILALKAAYLHTINPSWRIAVTFNTRSLKGQFRRLINNFCIEQSGEEPDWTKLRIVNAWGAPGADDRDGIYYEYCRNTGQEFYDFKQAAGKFGGSEKAFDGACGAALTAGKANPEMYDVMLIDEAQDFGSGFLRLCWAMTKKPKRLVYAYDELQSLSGSSMPPPEELFGKNLEGVPLVSLGEDQRRDVILQKCYRNSRPILVAAHALGFGIYREPRKPGEIGLVQMFDQPGLWREIGYQIHSGELALGKAVSLKRTNESSPLFLEEHSSIDDILSFTSFPTMEKQNEWLVEQIRKNLTEDELRHDDIVVIHPDPMTARSNLGPIRKSLFDLGIQSHIAGVDTSADVFFRSDEPSVTFTGIYRAKGNEAGMVYVVNAQDCESGGLGLATLRNRLFTAITRSKAWVRVVGFGPDMQRICAESERLKRNEFKIEMQYPDDALLNKLRIVHRDLSPQEKLRIQKENSRANDLARALESGEISPDDLDSDTIGKLMRLLKGKK